MSGRYRLVRQKSEDICEPLEVEDYIVQPCADASPPKWHLAHTSWFFETFLLKPYLKDYAVFNEAYEYLFNSYYHGVGAQFPRPRRGTLSRPTVKEVWKYRQHVDKHMLHLLGQVLSDEAKFRLILGLHHEEQHQELMLTDIKYNFGHNPLYPVYKSQAERFQGKTRPLGFVTFAAGNYSIGHAPPTLESFVFDNESPRHTVYVGDFQLADRLVTNGEYLKFIEAGGYDNFELWLSDAWSLLQGEHGFRQPLYWVNKDDGWYEYTLSGLQPLDLDQPVIHVSGYEADAYARWCDARLPSEAEWEVAAGNLDRSIEQIEQIDQGNFYEAGFLHPNVAGEDNQMFGDAWEWTRSSYGPYPGFKAFPGQLGEYNGKFMANQLVLRGGSCVTSRGHIRPTYRNFFYPGDRWQFSGIRLARDCEGSEQKDSHTQIHDMQEQTNV